MNECLAVPDLGGEGPEEAEEPQNRSRQFSASLKNTAKKTLAGAKSSAEFVKHLHTLELDAVIDLEVSVRSALVARN